jgi:SAM-dependent methyltransferase
VTPSGSINFDRIAERYDATRGGEARGEQFAADIAPLLGRDRRILELGVGTGVIAKALITRGFDVVGIDISGDMLVRALERVGGRVVQGDAMALPVRTASLDHVLCVWMLHVVEDVPIVFGEIARTLRAGGTCLVMDGKAVSDPDDPIHAAFREIEASFGMAPRDGRVHEDARLAPGAGLLVEDIVTSGPHPHEMRIADAANAIATRTHSWMWDIDEDTWTRVSAPVVERLRRHPDFDRPSLRDGYQEILVLRR